MVKIAIGLLPNTRFILTDPSEKMLDQARKKLMGEERVQILKPTSTQELKGVMTERPDTITAIQCHHYLSKADRKTAVEVCFDLLQPGGIFATFENIRPFTARGIEDLGRGTGGASKSEMGKSGAEVDAHLARFDHEYFPITVEEHLELLRGVGFSIVELFWYSYMQAGLYCIK